MDGVSADGAAVSSLTFLFPRAINNCFPPPSPALAEAPKLQADRVRDPPEFPKEKDDAMEVLGGCDQLGARPQSP